MCASRMKVDSPSLQLESEELDYFALSRAWLHSGMSASQTGCSLQGVQN